MWEWIAAVIIGLALASFAYVMHKKKEGPDALEYDRSGVMDSADNTLYKKHIRSEQGTEEE